MAYGGYIGLSRGRTGVGLSNSSNGALNDVNKAIDLAHLKQKPEFAQIATLEAKYGNADKEVPE